MGADKHVLDVLGNLVDVWRVPWAAIFRMSWSL